MSAEGWSACFASGSIESALVQCFQAARTTVARIATAMTAAASTWPFLSTVAFATGKELAAAARFSAKVAAFAVLAARAAASVAGCSFVQSFDLARMAVAEVIQIATIVWVKYLTTVIQFTIRHSTEVMTLELFKLLLDFTSMAFATASSIAAA